MRAFAPLNVFLICSSRAIANQIGSLLKDTASSRFKRR